MSLKFYDFQSCNYDLGDITFGGIAVAGPVYYVYYLQCNEATGVVTNKTSQFYGKTLVLQMTGQLSEKGYGSQSLTFEIFCEEDEDCYLRALSLLMRYGRRHRCSGLLSRYIQVRLFPHWRRQPWRYQ